MNHFLSHPRRFALGLGAALVLLALPPGTFAQEQATPPPAAQEVPPPQVSPQPKEGKTTLSIKAELKTEGELARADAEADADAGADPDPDLEPTSDPDPDFDADEDSHNGMEEIVSIGHDSTLEAGRKATAVISVMGSSTNHGEVSDAVVSVMGDSHVTGPVGDAVVAVLGNVTVDSRIGGDAVAVLGNIELGPNADVGGQVVVVGGTVKRAATSVTRGGIEQVMGGHFDGFKWIRPWLKECLMLGRPLALAPGLEWAWTLAFAFLAFYVLLAVMFRGAMDRCVETFETQPGRTLLAALLAMLLSPVVLIVLAITIVGALLIPFVAIALFCVGLFGKAVILATLGRRVTRFLGDGPLSHTAVAVLIGGLLVLGLYLIPVVGFIVSSLIGLLSLGVVIYTILLTIKAERAGRSGPSGTGTAAAAGRPAAGYASAAAGAATTGTADASSASGASGASGVGRDAGSQGPAADSFTGAASTATIAALGEAVAYPRACFMVRMGALAIDLILIAVCASLVDHVGNIWLLLLAIYGAVMWKLKGTTIGGIVCGLKVVRLDGRPLDWATAIVRALSCFLSLAIAGLGFFWIIFDDERQGWHDKIAGTVVVRLPKGVSLV